MGDIIMSKRCAICNNKIGIWSGYTKINDGVVCSICIHKVANSLNFNNPLTQMQNLKISQMSAGSIMKKLMISDIDGKDNSSPAETLNHDEEFDMNRAIDVNGLAADFTSKIISRQLGFSKKNQKLYYFKDVTGYTPNIDGHKVKKHHGIARAATGGVLFGEAGAVVGALTGGKQYDVISNVSVTIYLANGDSFDGTMLSSNTKADSWIVKSAKSQLNEWCNLLDRIINDNQTQASQQESNVQTSGADEIRKYKSLLDDGIISQEEFDKKKNKFLNM